MYLIRPRYPGTLVYRAESDLWESKPFLWMGTWTKTSQEIMSDPTCPFETFPADIVVVVLSYQYVMGWIDELHKQRRPNANAKSTSESPSPRRS